MPYYIFIDTETTGLPRFRDISAPNQEGNWPDIVSVAWSLYEPNGTFVKSQYSIVKPDGWTIPADSTKIHGITTEKALEEGRPLRDVLDELKEDLGKSEVIIAHHLEFDKNVLFNAFKWRLNYNPWHLWPEKEICTMLKSTDELKLPPKYPKRSHPYKPPNLTELYRATFNGREPTGQHNSMKDVEILCEIYWARWPCRSA
jgi:DNA polymerase III epsilon subunit-like protein